MLPVKRSGGKPPILQAIPLYSAGLKRAEATELRAIQQYVQDFLTGVEGFESGMVLHRIKYQFLRQPESSLGYSVDLLEEATALNCTVALNGEPGYGMLYAAPLSRLILHGFDKDHGWGQQRFLATRLWDSLGKDGRIKRAKLSRQPEMVQGYLFEDS